MTAGPHGRRQLSRALVSDKLWWQASEPPPWFIAIMVYMPLQRQPYTPVNVAFSRGSNKRNAMVYIVRRNLASWLRPAADSAADCAH